MSHSPRSDAENKAILDRCASKTYRASAYDTIQGKSDVYNKKTAIKNTLRKRGTQPRTSAYAALSTQHVQSYVYSYQRNYKIGQAPYSNQAHHMIPCEALKAGEVFTDAEHSILRKVDYDVNNGDNLIFLPSRDPDRSFTLVLPYHFGPHGSYTGDVKQAMQKLKNKLSKYVKEKKCEKQDPPGDIKKDILSLQEDFWTDFIDGAYQGGKLD